MAILGCQLDYIWNELQSRIGRLTCDPNLEAEIQVSDLDLGIVAVNSRRLRSLSSRSSGIKGVVAHAFNLGHTLSWRPT